MKPLKIGFDIDGVIADTNALITKVSAEHLGIPLDPKDTEFYYLRYCYGGMSLDTETKIIDEVLTYERTKELQPIPGALETLSKWYEYTQEPIIMITSRSNGQVLVPFLENHINKMNFHYRIYYERNKGELCHKLGITHFMDDFIFNAIDVANHGIFPLIFDQPYNRNSVKSRFMTRLCLRIFNWKHFEEQYLHPPKYFVYYQT